MALCSGIGGFELGLGLALGVGYRCVVHVERDAYAASTLVARMEDEALDRAPIWDDISTFDGVPWRRKVDLISAGFPCQPFSTASRGRKVAIDLWPQVLRIIGDVQPEWVVLENVQHGPIWTAGRDLEVRGYSQVHHPFDPSEMGSPARRRRWVLLAHLDDAQQPGLTFDEEVASVPSPLRVDWWSDIGGVLGVPDGVSGRMDRLRVAGNGVVPVVGAHAVVSLARGAGWWTMMRGGG